MKHFNINLARAVLFFLIIAGTQTLIHAEKPVSFEQHVQVQQELSHLIATYVATHLPQMRNFKMHSVYTKAPKKGLMDAYFAYSFETPVATTGQVATTQLEGFATLRKIQETPNLEWALEKIEIEGETLTFTDPIVITADTQFSEVEVVEESNAKKETPLFEEVQPIEVTPTPPPVPAPTNAPPPAATATPETVAPMQPVPEAPTPTTESPSETDQ